MKLRHVLLPLMVLLAPLRAHAWSFGAAGLVEQGNAAYTAGDFAKAMDFYDQAAAKDRRPEISFNRGNVLFRQGRLKEAADLWQEAAVSGNDPDLAYAGRYNAGNALVQQGEAAALTDPQAALDLFTQGADSYRAALAVNPGGAEAGRNLELVNGRIAAMRRRLDQQHQAGDKTQRNKDEANDGKQGGQPRPQDSEGDSLRDLHDRQRQLRDESNELADRQRQGETDTAQPAEAQARQQQDLRRRTEEAAKKADGGQKEVLEQAANEQRQAEEALKNNQPQAAAEHQQAAVDKLARATAAEQENANRQQPDTPAAAGQQPQDEDPGQQQTAAVPPDDSAQAILNAEKSRQLLRQRMLRQGRVQVDKDW